jgi:uracil-DNA glycosylase family 4
MAFTQTPLTRDAYLALLDWYVESGVDIALDEAPHDRYAAFAAPPAPVEIERREPPLAPQAPATSPRARPLAPAIAAPDDAARAAQEAAAGAGDLADLAVRLAEFPHAPFRDMAQHFLLSTGAAGARLMAFDASPGATEESTGEAFSGLHAKLLDNMLAAIGHNRTNAYLAYVAPWRPPGDRPLTPQEAAIFAPFARRHVELARPDVLLLFGEAPARVMLTTNETLAKMRGKPFDVRGGAHSARAFVFSSLDSMLKSPAMKPAAWRDLRAAAEALQP